MAYNQNGFNIAPPATHSNQGLGAVGVKKNRPQSAKTGTTHGASGPNWIQPSIPQLSNQMHGGHQLTSGYSH